MGDLDLLVNALRDHARLTNLTGGHPLDRATLTGQAADEIDRLRAALRHYAKDYDHDTGFSVWDGGAVAREALTKER